MIKRLLSEGSFAFSLRTRRWTTVVLLAIGLPGLLMAAKTAEIAAMATVKTSSITEPELKSETMQPAEMEILNGEGAEAQTEFYPSSFAERGLVRCVDLVDCSIQRFEPSHSYRFILW